MLILAVCVAVTASAQSPRVPVVVELFTSEGCSSCPPADDLLTKLAKEQPVAAAEVIPLEMRVDYWDREGWKDPASLPIATQRQQVYGRIWGEDRVYTPQAVIDGRDEVVGSDEAGVTRAIGRAARQPHARVTAAIATEGAAMLVDVSITDVPPGVKEPLDALLIVTEDGLTSSVKGGENSGRTLHHNATVRAVYEVKDVWKDVWLPPSGGRSLHDRLDLKPEWHRDRLHVVVIVQGHKTLRIWGATETRH